MSVLRYMLWSWPDGGPPRLSSSPHSPKRARKMTKTELWLWEELVMERAKSPGAGDFIKQEVTRILRQR